MVEINVMFSLRKLGYFIWLIIVINMFILINYLLKKNIYIYSRFFKNINRGWEII